MTIRPNELTDPGTRAAWARVETLFQELDALGPSVPLVPVRGRLSAEDRDALMVRAETLVDGLSRGELLDAATEHLDAALSARLAGPVYRYSTNTARPEELAAISRALHDLLVVTIVEDRLASEDAARLSAAGQFVLGMEGVAAAAGATPSRVFIPEPSEDDWADAEAGPAAADPNVSPVGSRRIMAAGLWGAGAIVAIGLLAGGATVGSPALGIAGSVVALIIAGLLVSRR